MFSGLIEAKGEVVSRLPGGAGGLQLGIRVPFVGELAPGDSVAINGCCLTVARLDRAGGIVGFDLLAQTLRLTALGDLPEGASVNLERALRLGDRLGGHFVQGHIDGVGVIRGYQRIGDDHRLDIGLMGCGGELLVDRGSIAVDGVSLTVAETWAGGFTCWIIPHTHRATRLEEAAEGMRVNLEFDMIAKHVASLMGMRGAEQPWDRGGA